MLIRRKVIVTCLLLNLFLLSCTENELPPYMEPESVTQNHSFPEGVETTDASVFRTHEPSIFQHMEPTVTTEVTNEVFKQNVGKGTSEEQEDRIFCQERIGEDEMQGDNTVTVGYFRLTEEGELSKICTSPQCRQEPEVVCTHLTTTYVWHNIWYDNCAYVVVDTFNAYTNMDATRYMILKWEDGAGTFEKYFETEFVIRDLQVMNGILYVFTSDNISTDGYGCYLIDLEEDVYTYVSTSYLQYAFGSAYIIICERNELWLADEFLEPVQKVDGYRNRFYSQADNLWVLDQSEHILYRMNLPELTETTVVQRGVRDFIICGDTLYWIPYAEDEAETLFYYRKVKSEGSVKTMQESLSPYVGYKNLQVYRSPIYPGGILGEKELVFTPGEAEWLHNIGDMNGEEPVGNTLLLRTITPGDERYIKYYVHTYAVMEKGLKLVSEYAQPSNMD